MNIEELKLLQKSFIEKNNRVKKKSKKILFILWAITISIILFFFKNVFLTIFIGFVVCFFEFVITLIITSHKLYKSIGNDLEIFRKNYKKFFVLTTIQNNFDDVIYNSDKGFEKSFIDSIGMMKTGDRYYSNDHICARYRNTKFAQSDITIKEQHEEKDENGETKVVWETIFCGQLIIFDFNKKFKTNIQVSSAGFMADTLPDNKSFTTIVTESSEFNNNFTVYTENEHDAFYLLTPHFMGRLNSLYKKFNASIMFAFLDNKVYIAIDTRDDKLEVDPFTPIDEGNIIEKIQNDLVPIVELIDEINANNEIFN